jgi:ABC-type branched-subunit amino acid transport system ATPase component
VGGLDGLVGPVLGAFAVFGFAYLVPGQNTPAVQYIFSSLLLLIVLLRSPRGLVALVEAGRTRLMSLLVRSVEERPFAPISASPPLVADHVGVSFGGLRAVDDVSICVGAGEIVGLIGGNGAGKTTLMNCVSGHLTPDEGTIVIHGQRVEDLPPQFRAQLGSTRSFQNAALYPGLTVLECVLLSLDNKRPGSLTSAVLGAPWLRAAEREKRTEAMRCLEELGLADSADALTSQLSTGMRRLVDFASVIASRPSLLLLDEPTAGIAQREVESFAPVLRRLQADGCAILLIEHDMPLVMSVSDRVYCMEAGRVISEGPPAQVSADPRVIASYLGSDPSAIKRSDTTAATRASRRARSGKPADRAPAGATQDGSARRRRSASSGIATAANSVREPAEGASDEIRT